MVVLENEELTTNTMDVHKNNDIGNDENEVMDDDLNNNSKEPAAVKDQNKNLLSHFWNLASLDESVRSKSVVNLLNELKISRKEEDIDYTAQRLVKGLSSSRKAARQGFATALTHVMNEFNEVTSDAVIELMNKHLAVQGSFKGHEERDAYFGQIFGFLAIVRSKFHKDVLEVDVSLLKRLIESFLRLMKKKSYLQEVCGIAICDLLKSINYSTFETIQPTLEAVLCRGWEKCSPEELMIALTVQSRFKDDLPKKYFKEHWHRSEILHKANFKEMSRVLMDTTNTVHPRVHCIWDMIIQFLLSFEDDDDTFMKFWKIVIVDGFMHSTHERKFLVMNIILKLGPSITAYKVPVIFEESILKCMINSCQSKMNYLYSCVQGLLKKLPECLSKNEDHNIISCVIKSLVGCYGHVGFDSITKTKVIEELTPLMTKDLSSYFSWLKGVFNAGTTNEEPENSDIPEKDANECRAWVANQLVVLLRTSKHLGDEILLMEITNFLFFHAHFIPLKKNKKEDLLNVLPTCSVSDSTHQFCLLRFNTALTEIANIYHVKSENKSPVIGGIAKDGEWYTWKTLCLARKLLEMPKYVQLTNSWTPELYDSWSHSLENISDMLDEDKEKDTVNSKGAQLLFIHATLQIFSNREEAVDILKELEMCYNKATEKKRKKKTEPHWTEVLTEILLGFLAQASHLMRQVVDVVFPTLVPHLTSDALDLLLKAIKPTKSDEDSGLELENLSDVEEIDEEEREDIEKEVDDGNCDEDEAEVEENDKEEEEDGSNIENEEEKKENENDADSDSEESEESGESDFEVDEAFKADLKAALGDSAIIGDEENEGSDIEEDIDMDTCDPNMMKSMDKALADVFKSRRQKQIEKKKKKDKKFSILHFKLRVLDLIEIFIKRQPKDAKIIQFIEPLYEVILSSHGRSNEQPLFERTLGIFKNKLCNLHEYPSVKDLNVDSIHTKIESLVDLARSATSALLVGYISQGIIYLIRILRGSPEIKEPSPRATRSQRKSRRETMEVVPKVKNVGCLNEDRLIACYKAALVEFMTKKSSHLQPVLFIELIQRFPSLGWKLAEVLPQYLNDGCNNFRKVKAFEMLKLLFSKKTDNYQEYVLQINSAMHTNLITAFQATKDEKYSLKARQFHDIVQLSTIYFKEIMKHPYIYKEVDKDGIRTAVTDALESSVVSRSTSLQSYCKSFLSILDDTAVKKTPKKKKKRSKMQIK